MSLIHEKASAAVDLTSDKTKIDPFTIYMIVSTLISAIRAWQACRTTPKDAVSQITSKGFFTARRLRKKLRRIMDETMPQASSKTREEIEEALHSIGTTTTVEEMVAMFQEAEPLPT